MAENTHSGTTTTARILSDSAVLRLVQIALAEDVGTGDLTSEALVAEDAVTHATITARSPGVIAGTPVAAVVFNEVDSELDVTWSVEEGDSVGIGTAIGVVRGPARGLLTAERTALNFLQRLSGVATLTRQYVDAVNGTAARILDTRKTIPGWRLLDKYAVAAGGATNHRMGLHDMVMIKDNHIAAHGSIAGAVTAAREFLRESRLGTVPIEVETRTLDEVSEAVSLEGVDRIMFDNFSVDLLRRAVVLVGGRVQTEASGGVTLETVRAIAETGVDFISVGALTHSAVALDIALDIPQP